MKMLRKILDCESLKIFKKTSQVEFILVRPQALQYTDCISTINRLHNRFFSEDVPKY